MPQVNLQTVMLSLGSDLTQRLELDVAQIDETRTLLGEIRPYANGRRRAVVRTVLDRQIPLKAEWVTRAQRELLETWTGQLLLVRDPLGRKMWCTYLTMGSTSTVWQDEGPVSLQLQEISHDEAV